MVTSDDNNRWFDELQSGKSGTGRQPQTKRQLRSPSTATSSGFKSKSSSFSTVNYQIDLIDAMRIARRYQQAVVKVSGYTHSAPHVSAHLSYISREGALTLEDEAGNLVNSLEEQDLLVSDWETQFKRGQNIRHSAQLVLSTPPGTSPEKAKNAARAFLQREFTEQGYHYVWVLHDDTDHPHVHVCLNLYSERSQKLRLQPALLHKLRRRFAERCREQGIEVEASYRSERGLMGPSMKSSIAQLHKQNKYAKADINLLKKVKKTREQNQASEPTKLKSWQVKALKQRQLIRKYYKEHAQNLYESSTKAEDLGMKEALLTSAHELQTFAKQLPHIDNRYDELSLALETVESQRGDEQSKTQNLSQTLSPEDKQHYTQALKETLAQATVTVQQQQTWQDVPALSCQRLLEQPNLEEALIPIIEQARQPPVFIDADEHSAIIAIGHEKYAKLTLLDKPEQLERQPETKPAIEPIQQSQAGNIQCEIYSAAKIDNAKLLDSLISLEHKPAQSLEALVDKAWQATATQQQDIVTERELAKEQELEIDWDD